MKEVVAALEAMGPAIQPWLSRFIEIIKTGKGLEGGARILARLAAESPKALEALDELLHMEFPQPYYRQGIVHAVGEGGDAMRPLLPKLLPLLDEEQGTLCAAALHALAALGPIAEQTYPAVATFLADQHRGPKLNRPSRERRHPSDLCQQATAAAIAIAPTPEQPLNELVDALACRYCRQSAMAQLELVGPAAGDAAAEALHELWLRRADYRLRRQASAALHSVTGTSPLQVN